MKTSFYFRELVCGILEDSPLATEITGDIYNGKRPVSSTEEDIAVEYVDGLNGQYQRATLSVKIYFADVQSDIGFEWMEQTERGAYLAQMACDILDGIETAEYMTYVEDQTSFAVEGGEVSQHCVNLKLIITQTNF